MTETTKEAAGADIPITEMFDVSRPNVIVSQKFQGAMAQDIRIRHHKLVGDEAVGNGGRDLGPNPYELLMSALGECTAMTLRVYANHKEWNVEHVEVRLNCFEVPQENGPPTFTISRGITIKGNLDDAQRQRLLEVAIRCPLNRIISGGITTNTRLVE